MAGRQDNTRKIRSTGQFKFAKVRPGDLNLKPKKSSSGFFVRFGRPSADRKTGFNDKTAGRFSREERPAVQPRGVRAGKRPRRRHRQDGRAAHPRPDQHPQRRKLAGHGRRFGADAGAEGRRRGGRRGQKDAAR